MIGRIVRLEELATRTELNGTLANIESFNDATQQFSVRPLSIEAATANTALFVEQRNIRKTSSSFSELHSEWRTDILPPTTYRAITNGPIVLHYEGGVKGLLNHNRAGDQWIAK